MSVAVYVVHHPRRHDQIKRLLDDLDCEPIVVIDPQPERFDPWANWKNAFKLAATRPTTHSLFLEDDVLVCKDLSATVERCVAARPDQWIRYYHPGPPHGHTGWRPILERGEHWWPIDGHWGCVQAISAPTAEIPDFLQFATSSPREWTIYPDARVNAWLKRTRRPVWTTVPCLVDHGGSSLCGQPGHTAPPELFIGTDQSGLTIDW